MHPHQHRLFSSFRHDLFIFFSLIIFAQTNNPIRFSSAQDDEQYTNCSRPFECGGISTSFPFWGQNRPSYCGHPGFKLECSDNDITSITDTGSQRYRVMDIDEETQIITIARMDILDGICPPESLSNFMTNLPLFDFTSTKNQNLSVLYGCTVDLPSLFTGPVFNFTCKVNDAPRDLYITGFADSVTPGVQTIGRCSGSVVVPVLQTAAAEFWSNNPSDQKVGGVLNKGFELRWKIDGAQCQRCRESGRCGYNDNASNPFVCFCSDGPREATCSGSPVTIPSGPELEKFPSSSLPSLHPTHLIHY